MAKTPINFKHQSVRDLAWAISSPPLISQPQSPSIWPDSRWYQQAYQQRLSWLDAVDQDPAEFEELLSSQKDRRLGKYFETLWLYWIRHHPRYQLVENNLQVIIDGETLGEIDFIVFDNVTGRTMHWELAVKFYLGVGDTRLMVNWHGPNLRDRLDIKFSHLQHRQSVISKDQRVAGWLKQRDICIDQCLVILKGRLYYPWHETANLLQSGASLAAISPAVCSPDHESGLWMRQKQLDQAFDSQACFLPLINTGWLERISTTSVKKPISKNVINETVSNKVWRLPLHVQCVKPHHSWD
ncbi:MAG: DUF1853 family protein, partial [Gammaproteobacteria bacterium]|nr:DUF1853 family protein [Gammaproteobacteria bacterium]